MVENKNNKKKCGKNKHHESINYVELWNILELYIYIKKGYINHNSNNYFWFQSISFTNFVGV